MVPFSGGLRRHVWARAAYLPRGPPVAMHTHAYACAEAPLLTSLRLDLLLRADRCSSAHAVAGARSDQRQDEAAGRADRAYGPATRTRAPLAPVCRQSSRGDSVKCALTSSTGMLTYATSEPELDAAEPWNVRRAPSGGQVTEVCYSPVAKEGH